MLGAPVELSGQVSKCNTDLNERPGLGQEERLEHCEWGANQRPEVDTCAFLAQFYRNSNL